MDGYLGLGGDCAGLLCEEYAADVFRCLSKNRETAMKGNSQLSRSTQRSIVHAHCFDVFVHWKNFWPIF